ncbi:MAG: hypothetical protein WBV23_10165 [Desulfobaccales bacterium]
MGKWSASITLAGLALGSLLLRGSPAGAQSVYDPHMDQREAYQQQRIQQGIDNGSLTSGEAGRLENEQARIQATEDRMKADGNLSPRERERLSQMQNRASQDINRLENNNRTAGGGGNYPYGWSGHTNSGWGGQNYGGRGDNTYDPRIDRREAYQQQRIQQGINNGSLTPGEARYLKREQGRIDRAEDRMKADGNLSPQERLRLSQMQNRAGQDINRLENNNRTTAGYSGNQAGWRGNNGAWRGNNPGGGATATSGTPTAGNNQGWRNGSGNGTAASGTTTASNATGTPQGWQGPGRGAASTGNANYRNGQPGSYQQPGAQAGQGGQQYQRPSIQGTQSQMRTNQPAPGQGQYRQARAQMPQTQMRPNGNMMARQPFGLGRMVNRASFSVPRAALRRR